MNPRMRRAALYAIGAIAILASANALSHSYAGLYDWAVHHRLTGWQAKSWPAEIDVFLAVGELALYVAYLDGWPARQRIWPWATAVTGLAVSVAGNIGHIQAEAGHPVILTARLTAATSPIAAFAGLSVGLLVLKMTREQGGNPAQGPRRNAALVLARRPVNADVASGLASDAPANAGFRAKDIPARCSEHVDATLDSALLCAASAVYRDASARGERLSQRALARALRGRGHRFPNAHLRLIAQSTEPGMGQAA